MLESPPAPLPDEVSVIPAAKLPVREVLARYEIVPRKRFGQNFLHDPAVCRRIVGEAGLSPGDEVLEIGPGLGALTRPMLDGGARVTAVEVDRRIADYLTDTFGGNDAFRLHLGDVLETDLARVAPEARRLIANLPYSITGPVLSLLIDAPDRFDRCVLMVQREVGARLTASRGRSLGAPSVMLQLLFQVKKCFDVGKGAFLPPPDIVSTVLRLDRRPGLSLPSGLRDAVNVSYRQRRKMVRKTLAGIVAPEADLAASLVALGLPDSARPEDLPPAAWPAFLQRARESS